MSTIRIKRTLQRFLVLTGVALLTMGAAEYGNSHTLGPANGWLVIHGGGIVTPEVRSRFIALAGGPNANFVVIPTAGGDTSPRLDSSKAFSQGWGLKNVTVLHTRDRERANSNDFVEPLRHATGVWIEGGRQWRLADAYLGTAVEREIKALLARGGVVGGSSAGATIQGSFLVRGDPAHPNNPDGDNTLMMVSGHETGFALLANSAIDQHVIARHREKDLDSVITAHPDLLGIGIDESTAILVHGDRFEVIGTSKVIVHESRKPYYFLDAGQSFNMKSRKIE